MFLIATTAAIADSEVPGWTVMWLMAIGVFGACKLLTWSLQRQPMSAGATLAYLFAWPGLNPVPFTRERDPSIDVTWGDWVWAFLKTAFGLLLIGVATMLPPTTGPLLIGWIGLIGLGFLLHFGTFDLLACLWRSAGYDVEPLMDAPHRATSLTDFWSRRWNRAFRDLSNRFLLRPLLPRVGVKGAMLAVFLFSGVVHDVVISIPARAGYGLPTLYFLWQALGVHWQRTGWAKRCGLSGGFRGWLMTAVWVVGPLPLLFHPPFIQRIVVPFVAAIRGV